jgi:hypothetical protein
MKALGFELRTTELLLANGTGSWVIGELETKVIGEAPVLVPVEFAGGVSGGSAAVHFEGGCAAASPGTSFHALFPANRSAVPAQGQDEGP